MAKRPTSGDSDPFDDPFDSDIEPMDISDLRMDDVDDVDMETLEPRSSSAPRSGPSVGQLILGLIQVIIIAVIALAIFLGIGAGLIIGGQKVGLLPTRVPAGFTAPLVSALPTGVAPPQQPTTAAQAAPTSAAPAVPSATPNLGCPNAAAWWKSQQIQDNYTYFTQQAISDVTSNAKPLPALIDQMNIRSSFVANFHDTPTDQPDDSCVNDARDAFVQSMNATIDVARVVGSSDQSTLAQKQATEDQAYAKLDAALWAVNVSPDTNVAVPGVAKGSGGSCGAQTWYASVKPHVDAFYAAAQQIDASNTSGAHAQITTMQTERGNVAAVSVPDCAQQAQQLLLGALDGDLQVINQKLGGNSTDAAQSDYARQNRLYLAWLQWLGVS